MSRKTTPEPQDPNAPVPTSVVDIEGITKGWFRIPLVSRFFTVKKVMNELWLVYVTTVLLWIVLGSDSIIDINCDFSELVPSLPKSLAFSSCSERPPNADIALDIFRTEFDAYWTTHVKRQYHLPKISDEDSVFYSYDVDFHEDFASRARYFGVTNTTSEAEFQAMNLTLKYFALTAPRYMYSTTMTESFRNFERIYDKYDWGWCLIDEAPFYPYPEGWFPPTHVTLIFCNAFLFLLLFVVSTMTRAVDDKISRLTESDDEFRIDFELNDIYTIYFTPTVHSLCIAFFSSVTMSLFLYLDNWFNPETMNMEIKKYCDKGFLYEIPFKCFVAGNIIFGLVYLIVSCRYFFFRISAFKKWDLVMRHIGTHDQWIHFTRICRPLFVFDIFFLGLYGYFFWYRYKKRITKKGKALENGIEKCGVFTDDVYLSLRQQYLKVVNGSLYVFLDAEEARGFGVAESLVDLNKIGLEKATKSDGKGVVFRVKGTKPADDV